MTAAYRVGGKYRYGHGLNALDVWIDELLPGGKARVSWYTAGRKAPGKRYYAVAPAHREKVVRLTSLHIDRCDA